MRPRLKITSRSLDAVFSPYTLSPIAVAASLGSEQAEWGISVARIVRGYLSGKHSIMEQCAGLFHGDQHLVIATEPRDAVGPAASGHMRLMIFVAQRTARNWSSPSPGPMRCQIRC
jgi:hypothetical protein